MFRFPKNLTALKLVQIRTKNRTISNNIFLFSPINNAVFTSKYNSKIRGAPKYLDLELLTWFMKQQVVPLVGNSGLPYKSSNNNMAFK